MLITSEISAAANARNWWAVGMRDGKHHTETLGHCEPTEQQKVWAREMLDLLTKEIAHEGEWAIAWTQPKAVRSEGSAVLRHEPTVWAMLWADADGDAHFQVRVPEALDQCWKTGREYYAMAAEAAWQEWRERDRAVEISETQKFKRALGETPSV